MKKLFIALPWFFVALFSAEIIAVFMPKKDGEFHTREFGRLPAVMNGRVQPLDSVARNSLLQIRSTGDVPLEMVPSWKFWHHPKKLRSSEWLLEVLFHPEQADTRHIFLVHHPELLSELNLLDKGIEKSGLRYYPFTDLRPHLQEIWTQGAAAREADKEKRATSLQKQVIKLQNALFLYQALQMSVRPPMWEDFSRELRHFEHTMPALLTAIRSMEAGARQDDETQRLHGRTLMQYFSFARDQLAGKSYPLIYPPGEGAPDGEDWGNAGSAIMLSVRNRSIHPALQQYAVIAEAYTKGDAAGFNQAVAGYKEWLGDKYDRELRKGRLEFFYNDTKAFLHALIMYICAFVLACGALLTFTAVPALSEALRKSSLYLIILAGLLHTFGLIFRMYLEGRPPVTNLYSSAIFIGWGAVVLGIILERFYKVGLGNASASLSGFVTLIIAHNLALGGDTMEMMRAVLDTNFWLATHVVVITLGYSAMFIAGVLAIGFIVVGVFSRLLTVRTGKVDIGKALSKMVYAIICFGTLFSFAGTVLGGIWADQSWGRFWGWDPKENGALLIVLWCAVILHARWGGLVRERGLMIMAIVGNVVTAWSWFGVNMLGVGLHSYGFMDAAFKWLMLFVGTQVTIIALGSLPLRYWRSYKPKSDEPDSLTGAGTAQPATA